MKKLQKSEFELDRVNLDFLDTSSENVSDEMCLDYLARVIADIYIRQEAKDEDIREDR